MNSTQIAKMIDHTILKATTTKEDVVKICKEAKEYGFFSVCINPANIELAKEELKGSDVKVCTVIGFPLGANTSAVKAFETKDAIAKGADEVDMVINVQSIKDKNYNYTQKDIETVKKACGTTPLKVIIETDLLTKDEIKKACELIINAKADFAKTSTGFVKNGVGAKVEDIELMHEALKGSNVRIKASGGIKDREKALALINAGADRLGTSSGVKLMEQN